MNESKTLKEIKELNAINLEIYTLADKLKTYNLKFGLAYQHLRDATVEIQKAMSALLMEMDVTNVKSEVADFEGNKK